MSWHQYECPSCGEPIPSLFGSIFHCDMNAPIDDIDDIDDYPGIIRGSD